MIAAPVVLGTLGVLVVLVAVGIATVFIARSDSPGRRPYCDSYNSRRPTERKD